MCVGYCGSFPILFDAIDREIEAGRAEGAETVVSATMHAVSDHCWQCKLCYIKCPYTPDEGAYEALDFPRLMAREKAQRARRKGIPVVDQVLGEPQLIGALGAPVLAADVSFTCGATGNGIGLQIEADNPGADRLTCTVTCTHRITDPRSGISDEETSFTSTDKEVAPSGKTQVGVWFPSYPEMTWRDPRITSSSCRQP